MVSQLWLLQAEKLHSGCPSFSCVMWTLPSYCYLLPETCHQSNTVDWSATLILCTYYSWKYHTVMTSTIQNHSKQSCCNSPEACHRSSTFIIITCVRFSNLSTQVTEGSFSTAWGSKQTNLNIWNWQNKQIQEYFSFQLCKPRSWFLWIICLVAKMGVYISCRSLCQREYIHANIRSNK